MAIDLCSDSASTLNMSPRYSFSHDLSKTDNILPVDLRRTSFDSLSNVDFDFNIRETLDHDSSSADELFSDGMIRSVQIKKDVAVHKLSSKQKERHKSSTKTTYIPPPPIVNDHDDHYHLKAKLESENDQKQNSSKSSSSFWRFKRSSSLNCGSGSSGYASSLCPLPLLSRSNSAGSASIDSSKRNHQKQNPHQKHSSSSSFVAIKSSHGSLSSSNHQKPPLKKSVYGSYGNNTSGGVHVNPLLHVHSASLFGFGSIFSNGKVKNNKAR